MLKFTVLSLDQKYFYTLIGLLLDSNITHSNVILEQVLSVINHSLLLSV